MAQAPAKKRGSLLQFALIFGIVYLGSQFILQQFFPEQFGSQPAPQGIIMRMQDDTLTTGHAPVVIIENRMNAGSGYAIAIPGRCPKPPLDIFRIDGSTAVPLSEDANGDCASSVPSGSIAPGQSATINLSPWKNTVFTQLGTYEVRLPLAAVPAQASGAAQTGSGTRTGSGTVAPAPTIQQVYSARFTISEPGAFTKFFRVFILAPFLNLLVLIASVLPDHNLGIAIIVLTLLIKLLLYLPTKHAMEGQKKMQMLQPKMEALKKQHAGDPRKLQEETMKLWKDNNINPFQSCLPTLIQLPILIGLFYVIRDSSSLDAAKHLLYPVFENHTWQFNTNFFGLDLLKPSIYLMPPLLVVLQFLQMKLAFSINDRKKAASDGVIDVTPAGEKPAEKKKDPASPQQMQQRIMLYGLPIMIGVFAFQFPAAVSLYWAVSTLFGIGQQALVNKEHLRVKK